MKQKKLFEHAWTAGFTLAEVLMVIALLGILLVISINVITNFSDDSRFQATLKQMKDIRNAMIGDPAIIDGSHRSNFGFLGDVGAIPTNAQGIAGLITNPTLPAWSLNATVRIGIGWNGPYLRAMMTGTSYTVDAWGTSYVYDSTLSPPTLISYGADRVAGGTGLNQDITLQIPTTLTSARVYGSVLNSNLPWSGAGQVELNYPVAGVLTQTLNTMVSTDNGTFQFTSIPFGVRSITFYQPTKASPTTTVGPVVFTADQPNVMVTIYATGLP